jgi:hypothetical protein
VSDPAKPRQIDVGDVCLEQAPGKGMAQLVQQDREEEAHDDDEACRHCLGAAGREVGIGEDEQHQHEHHVEVDRDARDAAQLHAGEHCGFIPLSVAAVAEGGEPVWMLFKLAGCGPHAFSLWHGQQRDGCG